MSERKPSLIVTDILNSIMRIQAYTTNISQDEFSYNFMAAEACLYNIQVIGEAVSHLPEDIKLIKPQIPWVLIKGMRNRLIHEYFGTDFELVWNVIKTELPGLKAELENLLQLLTEQSR